MFASPNVRAFGQSSHENNGISARKAGLSNAPIRKAFGDRTVNEKTPQIKGIQNVKKSTATPFKIKSDYEPLTASDFCTYEPYEDTYEDIMPKSERLDTRENMLKILRAVTKQPDNFEFNINPALLYVPEKPVFTLNSIERAIFEPEIIDIEEPVLHFDDLLY